MTNTLPCRTAMRLQLLAVGLLVVMPVFSGHYLVHVLTLALIFAIFAVGYDVLFGHVGIVSFGHSVLFGLPAYVIAILGTTVFKVTNPLVLILAALMAGLLLGALMGLICSFSRGIYLAILTFAIAHIFELGVLSDPGGITFGENGVVGVRPGAAAGWSMHLFSGVSLYYLTLGLLVAVMLGVTVLMRSQWGEVFHGIRENEERLGSIGFNTRAYKILAFAISGGIAAIAGAMAAFHNNIVSPAMVDWQVGAEILLIVALGGAGNRIGPVLGAFVVVLTEAFATSFLGGGNWVYVLGGLYILVAMYLPEGIVSKLAVLQHLVLRLREGKGVEASPAKSVS